MIDQARLLTLKAAHMMDTISLPYDYASIRALLIADGSDEVRRNQIAKLELRKYREPRKAETES